MLSAGEVLLIHISLRSYDLKRRNHALFLSLSSVIRMSVELKLSSFDFPARVRMKEWNLSLIPFTLNVAAAFQAYHICC